MSNLPPLAPEIGARLDRIARTGYISTIDFAALWALGPRLGPIIAQTFEQHGTHGWTRLGKAILLGLLARVITPTETSTAVWQAQSRDDIVCAAACDALWRLGPDLGLPHLEPLLTEGTNAQRMCAALTLQLWAHLPEARALASRALDAPKHATETSKPPALLRLLDHIATSTASAPSPMAALKTQVMDAAFTEEDLARAQTGIVHSFTAPSNIFCDIEDPTEQLVKTALFITRLLASNPKQRWVLWKPVFKRHKDHPLAPWVALLLMDLAFDKPRKTIFRQLHDIFGEALVEPFVFAFWQTHKDRGELYVNVHTHTSIPDEVHLAALRDPTSRVRETASVALVQRGVEMIEPLVALLKHNKSATRAQAAHCLGAIGHLDALQALRAAHDKERTAKTREAIHGAIARCSTDEDQKKSIEIYTLTDQIKLNDGLALLRELVYEAPGRLTWIRMSNAVDRLAEIGARDMALDYLRDHGVHEWPGNTRASTEFDKSRTGLVGLGGEESKYRLNWLSVHALSTEQGPRLFAQLLHKAQRRARSRTFPPNLLPDVLEVIQRIWDFCAEQGLSPWSASLRIDGGTGKNNPAQCTALTLHNGFGLLVQRRNCLGSNVRREGMVRLALVRVAKGHPAALKFPLNRTRHINLLDVLWPDGDAP